MSAPRTERNVHISIIFVPLCFSGLCTVLFDWKSNFQKILTLSDYIKKKNQKSSWQLSANYLPDLRQAKWVLLCVYQPFLIESSV